MVVPVCFVALAVFPEFGVFSVLPVTGTGNGRNSPTGVSEFPGGELLR